MSAILTLSEVGNQLPREDAEQYRAAVADLLQRNQRSFPGAQPVSFSRQHIQELKRTE